jgi:hypothetical protein
MGRVVAPAKAAFADVPGEGQGGEYGQGPNTEQRCASISGDVGRVADSSWLRGGQGSLLVAAERAWSESAKLVALRDTGTVEYRS